MATHLNIKNRYGRVLLALSFLLSALSSHSQTYVTSPMTGTPAPGDYYHNNHISAVPNFSFVPAAGQYLHLFISPFCVPLATVPSADKTYIMTSTPRVAGITDPSQLAGQTACNLMQSITYFDGLGRPIQTVQVKASPGTNDLVQPVEYDPIGREVKKYLPYALSSGTSDGSYKSDALTSGAGVAKFYNPTGSGSSGSQQANGVVVIPRPFAETGFEASPLDRVIEQGAPGDPWQLSTSGVTGAGHTAKSDYSANNTIALTDTTNSRIVALYTAAINSDQSRTLARAGNNAVYGAGQLTMSISKNENWTGGRAGTVETYTDKDNHVVLKRTFNFIPGSPGTFQILSTYYVYDYLGNLAFVLPPGASPDSSAAITQATLDNFCYQYRYDDRDRPTQKKIPGKGWEYAVYNRLDQPVLTQDANQRVTNQWTVTKYDPQGRMIISGLWNAGSVIPLATLQTSVYAAAQYDVRNHSDNTTGYTVSSYPATGVKYLTINYYDDYVNVPGMPASFAVAPAGAGAATGLLTASQTVVLNTIDATPAMLWSAHYYDGLGRNIKTYQQHYLNKTISTSNYDEIAITYNFTNQPTTTTRLHHTAAASGNVAVTIANQYNYDQIGRKISTWKQITNAGQLADTRIQISKNSYNEIGQLLTKHLHSTDSTTYKQDIAYLYNERGWLRQGSSSYFEEQLQYNTGALKQYNGNIAYQNWGTGSSPDSKTYTYTYDPLNRLISASSTDNFNENNITYDLMGNIKSLNRYAGNLSAPTDLLVYNYLNGSNLTNQLQTITDNSGDNTNVKAGGPYTYAYDANGNITTDPSRNSGTINTSYNLLNLPKTITGAKTITYYDDADGQKLRRESPVTGNTDYISGIQYDGTTTETLSFIQTEEGRALPDGAQHYNYEYFLTDHLGNSRVSFDSKTGVTNPVQVDDYYAFGLEINRNPPIPLLKNNYLYNKKELQEELGVYDYGARSYDPVVGRWNTVDPIAENTPSLSPYNYVANNPVLLDDPNGMDWTIHARRNKNGELEVDITVNAAVLNSSGKKINLDNYIRIQKGAFSDIMSIKGKDYSVSAHLNLRAVNDKSEVKDNEHLIEISNPEQVHFGKNIGGFAQYGGLRVDINSKFINEDGTSVSNAALTHEIGHTGGLIHAFEDNTKPVYFPGKGFLGFHSGYNRPSYNQLNQIDVHKNFMSYPENYIPLISPEGFERLHAIYAHPGQATIGQINAILKYYQNGDLNKDNK